MGHGSDKTSVGFSCGVIDRLCGQLWSGVGEAWKGRDRTKGGEGRREMGAHGRRCVCVGGINSKGAGRARLVVLLLAYALSQREVAIVLKCGDLRLGALRTHR